MKDEIKSKIKKIKVCFFSPASSPFFMPSSNAAHGGAELQMYLWAKYLSEKSNFKLYFLLEKPKKYKLTKKYNIQLISTIQQKYKDFLLNKIFKGIKLIFQLIRLKPDVIICTNANAVVGIIAFYSKHFGKKFIYRTSHEIDVNKEYILRNGFSGKIYKYGLKKAAKVITQNNEHKVLLKKNHNINACVLKNFFQVEKQNLTDKKQVLWVSRFVDMKNPDLFLKLASEIPSEKFVMICPYNPPDYKKWLILKQKAEKITNLTFIKKVAFYEIQDYFNKAKIFINTSDFEGFPNTFLQAAQGKTPIVSLNVNPDNFITEYDCGIFANGDFDKMISGVKNLLQNENIRIKKAENLFCYLKENHDFNKNGEKLLNIIENLL